MKAKPGERVRFFFMIVGPRHFSALHLKAEVLGYVRESGTPENRLPDVPALVIGPSGGAVTNIVVEQEGGYPVVAHSLACALGDYRASWGKVGS